MNKRVILLIFAIFFIQQSHSLWFSDVLISPFVFLKISLFGRNDFDTKGLAAPEKKIIEEFKSRKNDGLSLAYNMIYLNFVLNLHKVCLGNIEFKVKDCKMFLSHMKSVIEENVKVTTKESFDYILIDDLFSKIFDLKDFHLQSNQSRRMVFMLKKINDYLNSEEYIEEKNFLSMEYNSVLEKLMKYFVGEIEPIVGRQAETILPRTNVAFYNQEENDDIRQILRGEHRFLGKALESLGDDLRNKVQSRIGQSVGEKYKF